MKKIAGLLLVFSFMLAGCGNSDIEVEVETVPTYTDGETSTIALKATDNGEAVEGLEISGLLEMARMDHGTIEVFFEDNGSGLYSGEVELPMGGEWIMDTKIEQGGSVQDEVITFEVSEG